MITRFVYLLVFVLAVIPFKTSACTQNPTCSDEVNEDDSEDALHLRQKRWLTMIPNGGVCKILFSVAAPVRWAHKLRRSLAVAVNVQANYRIPAEIIWPHAENFFKERVLGNDYVDNSRGDLYRLLERMIESWGGDGRECLLKTICQIAETPLSHNGLIGEILDEVFTPSQHDSLDEQYQMAKDHGTVGDKDCTELYFKCPVEYDLLSKLSKIVNIN